MAGNGRAEQILALDVPKLASAIAGGDFSSVEVMQAFRSRAMEVNEACNAVTYWIEDCEDLARQADEHLRSTGTTLGPLHGVPFTVKDHVEVRDTPATLGLLTNRRRIEERKRQGKRFGPRQDDPVVAALRSLGAIPYAKTTMSQLGNTWGGGCPAFGDTLNPWDTLRTTGGSSAGEGALVGGGASPFGIGSDIGGSLRIPSAFCGISTLKPTTGRLALFFPSPGDYSVPATSGIMAKTAEEVGVIYSYLFSATLYNRANRLARIPFDHAEFASTRKLRIGYYFEEYTQPKPCPTVTRAMDMVIEALRRRGHELVLFQPHSQGILRAELVRGLDWSFSVSKRPPKGQQNQAAIRLSAEQHLRSQVLPSWVSEDEPIHPDLAAFHGVHPGIQVEGFKNVADDQGFVGYPNLMATRDELRRRFYEYWKQVGLDVLVCPAWAIPACHVEEVRRLSRIVETTRVFNLLDMPAGVVPVTQITKADLQLPYEPSHPDPGVNSAALHSLDGSEGLPIGVQVVALPWLEELVLRVMNEVQAGCPFEVQHKKLQPVPRRSPALGAAPERVPAATGAPPARL